MVGINLYFRQRRPFTGLELRIWKGKAIYKKGTLDLGGHLIWLLKQKGTKAIQEKAKKATQKRGSKSKGGGGDSDTF